MMKPTLLAGAVLLIAVPWGAGFDDPKKLQPSTKEPAGLAGQINGLQKDFQKKQEELSKKISVSKDPAERSNLNKEYQELRPATEKQLLELVRNNPKDTATLKALEFVVEQGDNGKNAKEAMKLIADHHIRTAGVGALALGLIYNWRDEATLKGILRDVSMQNPNRDDRAKAFFAIGLKAKQVAAAEGVAESERNKAFAESTEALETLEKKYPDVTYGDTTLGSRAKGQLAGLKNAANLMVGKKAPDIVGEDLDGTAFMLSDYRGKVVYLTFWSHG